MSKIESFVTFVKEQVGVQEKLAKKYDNDAYRQGLHLKAKKNFADLAEFLDEIKKRGTKDTAYLNRGDSPQKRLHLTYEDIDGAPEDLLKELNVSETDKQELIIEYIIAQEGGILSLDRIMVELYKKTREIPKRATMTSRLFRMAGRFMIYNVPGKKGVYSTFELSEQDAKRMFGSDEPEPEANAESAPAATSGNSAKRKQFLLGSVQPSPPFRG